jgi:hypothetical protein
MSSFVHALLHSSSAHPSSPLARRNLYHNLVSSSANEPPMDFDPLLSPNQTWTDRFKWNELREAVDNDLSRLDWDNAGAQSKVASNILLLWARAHPGVSYRQGMHELLHVMILSVTRDPRNVDADCMESDLFFAFSTLMASMSALYDKSAGLQSAMERMMLVAGEACPEVVGHLAALDIPSQLFAIRWFRCLFVREFAGDDALSICEYVVQQGLVHGIVDVCVHVAAALLVLLRPRVLACATQTAALGVLLQVPFPDLDARAVTRQASLVRIAASPGESTLASRTGARLAVVVEALERELTSSTRPAGPDMSNVLTLIAQIKQLNEILLGRLEED